INANLTCISKSDYVEGRKIVNNPKILNRINKKFATAYSPSECLSIDESTITNKKNVAFKVYNLNKFAKHGIKVYMCSYSKTDYIYKLKICSERLTLVETVTYLLTGLENKWHKIFMDNFYNSLELCKKLLEAKFNVCGTLRVNRGNSKKLKSIKKTIKVNETLDFQKQLINVFVYKDKKAKPAVFIITTYHNRDVSSNFENLAFVEGKSELTETSFKNSDVEYKKLISKPPLCIRDYNKNISGVDLSDQMIKKL
ncbi:PiggyBac transposable element-derived protein 4, partial [Cucumispora dikerogammari]